MKKALLILCALFFFSIVHAQVFEATFGGDGFDVFNSVKSLDDNSMVATGYGTYDGGAQVILVKIDNQGQTVFAKQFGSDGADFAQALTTTNDGGFAICGWTTFNKSDDIFVTKTDAAGNPMWTLVFGDNGIDRGRAIMETSDGSIVAVGHSNQNGIGLNDVVVIKISADGEVQWHKKYGGKNNDNGWGVAELANGNYVVAGNSSSFSPGNFTSAYVIEIEPDGELQWSKTYVAPKTQMAANDCDVDGEGRIYLGGWIQPIGEGPRFGMVVRLNSDGTENYATGFGGNVFDAVNDIAVDGFEVLASGVTSSYFLNSPDTDNGFITRIDNGGSISVFQGFESGVGGDDDELFGVDLHPFANNGIAACGVYDADEIRQAHIIRTFDFWDDCPILFTEISEFALELEVFDDGSRIDESGDAGEPNWTATDMDEEAEIICSTGLNTNEEESLKWTVYPNPSTEYFEIEGIGNQVSIIVQDITGRTILEKTYGGGQIPTAHWSKGVYLIQVDNQRTFRLVKK